MSFRQAAKAAGSGDQADVQKVTQKMAESTISTSTAQPSSVAKNKYYVSNIMYISIICVARFIVNNFNKMFL